MIFIVEFLRITSELLTLADTEFKKSLKMGKRRILSKILSMLRFLRVLMEVPLLMLFRFKARAQSQGYGLALVMVFLMASLLLATSMTMLLAPNTVSFQQTIKETTLAKAVADQALSLAQTDVLNQMKLGTTISTSYRYPTSGTNAITIPSYPGSGSTTTVGAYYVTASTARGYTFMLKAVAMVGGTTIAKTRLLQLHAPSHVLDAVPTSLAAYSTRRLSLNYSGSALQVRRSSDGTTQDIGFDSSDNLNATTLASFIGAPTNTTPIDAVGVNAVAAYGIRKLKTSYAGSAIRVRRSSDNTEQDIGFDGTGELDTTSLQNFVGSSNGYVSVWYDQSGNGLNASQTTTSLQPVIVISGNVITTGTHAAIQFNGSNTYLTTVASSLFPSGAANRTMNIVEQATNASNWYAGYAWGSTTGSGASGLIIVSQVGFHGYGLDTTASVTADTNPHVVTVTYNGSIVSGYLDSTSVLTSSSITYNTTANTSLLIGRTVDTHYMTGNESEIIIYSSVLTTAQRTAMETNQNNYYMKGCGTVSIWYDQSGNGLNATQSTVASQPIICTGTLNKMAGRLTLQFTGSNYLSTATSSALPSGSASRTMDVVAQVTNISGWYGAYEWGATSTAASSGIEVGNQFGFHGYGIDAVASVTADTNPHVETVTYNGSTISLDVDGVSKTTGNANVGYNTTSGTSLVIGKTLDNHYLIGNESEAVIYARVLDSVSRSAIENKQLQYY
jgi:Alpha-L-arabinofuranosidase B, catalytic